MRLSIIIPFYNVEQYIAQCLDSVFQQDIPEEEYEVICVNDASPDHSRDIVLDYQKRHKNLIMVEHEVNKKLGAARNTGRKIARGKYIWNVDSDDMIAPNCLKEILNCCEENSLDVLLFGYSILRNGTLFEREKKPWAEDGKIYSGKAFWRQQCLKYTGEISPVWTKVLRCHFLDEAGIESPEINMGEDVPYSYKSVLFSQKMMACNIPYYIYRENVASLTGNLKKIPTPNAVYENSFVCGKYMDNLVKLIPVEEKEIIESTRATERFIVMQYERYAPMMLDKDVQELRRLCKKHFFKNFFVLNCLGKKRALKFVKFVFCGTREF